MSNAEGQYPQDTGVIMGREKMWENILKKIGVLSVYYCGNRVLRTAFES